MTTKVKGTEGIEFPDTTVQGSAALSAFIGSNQSLATDGYQKLPGGLILQWGICSNNNSQFNGGSSITFPIAFPTAVLHLSVEAFASSVGTGAAYLSAKIPFGSITTTTAIISWYNAANTLTTDLNVAQWFAIGY